MGAAEEDGLKSERNAFNKAVDELAHRELEALERHFYDYIRPDRRRPRKIEYPR